MVQTQTTRPIDKINKYLTAREVAELLAVTPTTLYLWARAGRGPRGVRIGREMRYDPADVQAWLDDLPNT